MCLIILIVESCRTNVNQYRDTGDDVLQFSVIGVANPPESNRVFKVRISSSLKLNEVSRQKQMTRMDSAFYYISNNIKIYPLAVESVANGIDNSFEYLVYFPPLKNGSAQLVYESAHINNRIYKISL